MTAPATRQRTDETAATTPQMQAIVRNEYGSTDVLRVAAIDRPAIGAGEVLVQVHAAGIDRGAWHLMTGRPLALRLAGYGLRRPKNPVLGSDVAGVVVAIGRDVTRFQPGDDVFGTAKGSFAEYAAGGEDKLALKPASLTFDQAAAMASSGLTALQAVVDVGRLQAGQHVAIVGASGGVGTYAVQIAKALGATVTGVCSASKVDLVRSIGADRVIDYTREDFAAIDKQYDLIVDIGGNSSLIRLRGALTHRGTLVIAGGETTGRWLGGTDRQLRALACSPFVKQRLRTFVCNEHHSGLERLTQFVADGHLTPVIERTYPLNETATAMRHLEAGNARGKLVITVADVAS